MQKIRTTVLIDQDDWNWIKKRGYKATSILRVKIKEMREGLRLETAAARHKENFDKAIKILKKHKLLEEYQNA